MHRSGTSAIAGYLDDLGIHGGKSLMQGAYDNPKGFYENTIVNEINTAILKYNNSNWSDVNPVELAWTASHVSQAKHAIKNQFSNSKHIYLKDPQISLLLNFWIEVFDSLGFSACHLFIIRDPSEIMASLSRRNNFSTDKSKALIQKYWISALSVLTQSPFVILDYGEILNDPNLVTKKLRDLFDWGPTVEVIGPSNINEKLQNNIAGTIERINQEDYLSKFYMRIKDYANSKENSLTELNNILDKKTAIDFDVIKKEEITELNFAKLFYDTGNGYNEKESFLIQHDGHQLLNEFQLPKARVVSVRIVPIHKSIQVSNNNLNFLCDNQLIEYQLGHNADSIDGNEYTFIDKLPTFDLTFAHPEFIDTIEVDINLSAVSKISDVKLESSKSIKSKAGLFLHSLMLFISQPFAFLKHINGQNMRTLRSALRRENPQTIFRNIKKLISSESTNHSYLNDKSIVPQPFNKQIKSKVNTNVIIYVCADLPEYDKSSGAQRAEKILSILSESSRVFVIYNKVSDPKYVEYYINKDIELYPIDSLKEWYMKVTTNVVTVIFNKYYTYQDYSSLLKYFPHSKIVIDAEDVAWVREERSHNYTELTTQDIERNKSKEIEAYSVADQLWCVTMEDANEIMNVLPESEISIVSNIHLRQDVVSSGRKSQSILFFANYNHEPNVTALKELLDIIFPIIKEQIPTATLIIAGSEIEKVEAMIPKDPNVKVLGYIEYNAISELYKSAAIIIAPLKFGSGIKGKITEAIVHRVPVITNAIGNEGINLVDKESGFITEDSKVMAQYAVDIFNKKYDIPFITENAYKRIDSLISYKDNRLAIVNSLYTKVSICIVTFNRLDLLRSCINSIVDKTSYPNYEMLVYSNGCNDGTQEYLSNLQKERVNVKTILSDSNSVYVEPNNTLIELANTNDVVLLNNDVEVHPNWLSELSHIARLNDECGIVGAKIIYPDGRLQEYGSEIYADGGGANLGKGDSTEKSDFNHLKSVPYVSGCCMYIKRSTIDTIGMLDIQYAPCYFEDSDYCYTAWKSDIMTLVTPKSIITHLEGASAGNDEGHGFKKYQAINREKFLSKHGNDIVRINKKAHSQQKFSTSIL